MRNPTEPTPAAVVDAAVAYAERGWSVLPLRGDKRPAVRAWKSRQSERARPEDIAGWFGRLKTAKGVGVVLGAVSGNLAARDFDDERAYHRWAEAHPDLAATLPTVQTGRGFHVYFRAESVKTKTLGDGELRGEGAYMVLPPSPHPSGIVYAWIVPLPDGELPEVDPHAVGLSRSWIDAGDGGCATERTENTERTETTENTETTETTEDTEDTEAIGEVWSEKTKSAIDDAISRTLPLAFGNRNWHVFKLCRALKSIPELAGINTSRVRVLKPTVREWHTRGLANMLTKDFGTTWADFAYSWPRVRFPEGDDTLRRAVEAAEAATPPAWAREDYTDPRMLLLASLCRELQRIAGEGVFFLSVRSGGEAVKADHGVVNRWLHGLVGEGFWWKIREATNRAEQHGGGTSRTTCTHRSNVVH